MVAAANNLFASKAVPQALMIHAVIPTEYEEEALKEDMRRIAKSAEAQKMRIIGGHTEVSRDVSRPWYHMTGIGFTPASDDENILKPGQELIVTKQIALAGTAALAFSFEEELSKRFPVSIIDRAKEFEKLMSVAAEAQAASRFGPVCDARSVAGRHFYCAVGDGGKSGRWIGSGLKKDSCETGDDRAM